MIKGLHNISFHIFVLEELLFLLFANNIKFLLPLILIIVLKLYDFLPKIVLHRILELLQLLLVIFLLDHVLDVVLELFVLLVALIRKDLLICFDDIWVLLELFGLGLGIILFVPVLVVFLEPFGQLPCVLISKVYRITDILKVQVVYLVYECFVYLPIIISRFYV